MGSELESREIRFKHAGGNWARLILGDHAGWPKNESANILSEGGAGDVQLRWLWWLSRG